MPPESCAWHKWLESRGLDRNSENRPRRGCSGDVASPLSTLPQFDAGVHIRSTGGMCARVRGVSRTRKRDVRARA